MKTKINNDSQKEGKIENNNFEKIELTPRLRKVIDSQLKCEIGITVKAILTFFTRDNIVLSDPPC